MTRIFAALASSLFALAACVGPDGGRIYVSAAYDQAWAQQRQLCQSTPQASHCDVYLRNPVPPAPYSTDGILIEQRRLCFETRSVADCSRALAMGRQAEGEASPRDAFATTEPPASAREEDDDGLYAPAPAVASAPSSGGIWSEPAPAPPRTPRRRATGPGASTPCTPAALDALDLVEEPVRAAILRRCASARP